MYGPTTMAFDPSGDLWVANENTSDLFEITRAQLSTRNPVPNVTIFAESGALANPFGTAFDQSGNLWVVGNNSSQVYEYTKSELATSGAPAPQATISAKEFPDGAFSDTFDAYGDLWVSTDNSVVEFPKAELTTTNPTPSVTISSSGGAQLVFDSSGNLWMVTGGPPGAFGLPGTDEVLEFARGATLGIARCGGQAVAGGYAGRMPAIPGHDYRFWARLWFLGVIPVAFRRSSRPDRKSAPRKRPGNALGLPRPAGAAISG